MEVVITPFGYEQLPDRSDPHRYRGTRNASARISFDHGVAPSRFSFRGTDKISIPVAMPTSRY